MRYLTIIILISFCLTSFGQEKRLTDDQLNSSGAQKLLLLDDIRKVREIAINDINNNLPLLLLQSGEASRVYPTDSLFEIKYNINYYESGCIGPTIRFAVEYNKYSFQYLDSKFGKRWRRDIRKDVIGIKQYRQK